MKESEPTALPLSEPAVERAVAAQDGPGLLRAQLHRFKLMELGDCEGLSLVIADGMTYIHSGGSLDTKESFLARLRQEPDRYAGVTPLACNTRTLDSTGIAIGIVELKLRLSGETRTAQVRFTEVSQWSGDRLRMLAWQSTVVQGVGQHAAQGSGHSIVRSLA